MEVALIGLAIAALFLVGRAWAQRLQVAGYMAELRRVCFGDERMAERLIEGELRRASTTISRAEAARRAVERHRRDNR